MSQPLPARPDRCPRDARDRGRPARNRGRGIRYQSRTDVLLAVMDKGTTVAGFHQIEMPFGAMECAVRN